jgi:hypothetical protein
LGFRIYTTTNVGGYKKFYLIPNDGEYAPKVVSDMLSNYVAKNESEVIDLLDNRPISNFNLATYGHSKEYWDTRDKSFKYKEAVAGLSEVIFRDDDLISTKEELKFVKKHLPRIYNIFIDIFAKGAWI